MEPEKRIKLTPPAKVKKDVPPPPPPPPPPDALDESGDGFDPSATWVGVRIVKGGKETSDKSAGEAVTPLPAPGITPPSVLPPAPATPQAPAAPSRMRVRSLVQPAPTAAPPPAIPPPPAPPAPPSAAGEAKDAEIAWVASGSRPPAPPAPPPPPARAARRPVAAPPGAVPPPPPPPATSAAPPVAGAAAPAAAAAPGMFTLKRTHAELPSDVSAAQAPPQRRRQASQFDGAGRLAFVGMLIMFANGLISVWPAVREYMASGKLETAPFLIACAPPFILALLVLSRKPMFVLVGGVLCGIEAVAASVAAVVSGMGWMSLTMLPPAIDLAAAAGVLAAATVLLTGGDFWQWLVSVFFLAGGTALAVLPRMDLLDMSYFSGNAAPVEPVVMASDQSAVEVSGREFAYDMPRDWRILVPGEHGPQALLGTADGELRLAIYCEPVAEGETLAAVADARLETLRSYATTGSGIITDVEGKKDRKRIFFRTPEKITETLVVQADAKRFVLVCEGKTALVQARRSDIGRFFQSFNLVRPKPAPPVQPAP